MSTLTPQEFYDLARKAPNMGVAVDAIVKAGCPAQIAQFNAGIARGLAAYFDVVNLSV